MSPDSGLRLRAVFPLSALFAWSLFAAGCTVIRQSYDAPTADTATFQTGKTHFRDVLETLGPPAKLSALGEDMVFLYEEADLTETQFGINIEIRDIPLLKVVLGRGHAARQATAMIFDTDGRLRSAHQEDWIQKLGGGAGIQVVVAVVPVTDPGGLDRSPAVHDWGAMLLQPELPAALNRQSNLHTGQAGIQQIGTPLAAGQHTLELRASSPMR